METIEIINNDFAESIFVAKVLLHTSEWQISFLCEFCNENLSTLPDLLRHVLTEHMENVPQDKLEEFCAIEEVALVDTECDIIEESVDEQILKEEDIDDLEQIDVEWDDNDDDFDDGKKFLCEDCGASFTRNNKLKEHNLRHLGIKPHSCNVCQKAFTTTTDLKQHMRIHTMERPYKCNLCGESFRLSSKLSTHQRREHNKNNSFRRSLKLSETHLTERPYKCTKCSASFKFRKGLRQHVLIHSEVKRYSCEFCGKRFAQDSGLAAHKRRFHMDDDVRPFECEVCDASFKVRKGLSQHMLIHSELKRYCCEFCGKRFAQRASVASHRKRFHKNDILIESV